MEWLTDVAPRRRRILQLGVAAAGGLMDLAPRTLAAESQTPLGTWPEGVHGDSVMLGITVPLTGPYSADGKDERLGYELQSTRSTPGAKPLGPGV